MCFKYPDNKWWGRGLGGVEGGKSMAGIYCKKEESISNTNKERKEKKQLIKKKKQMPLCK